MKTRHLLSRDEFRTKVFQRDGGLCVVCKSPAVDAHHIMERRLFEDGGYYLDNGVSLCESHHLEVESTKLSTDLLRELAGIKDVILPEHLYGDIIYDKWANIIQPNGTRLVGELFHDESVQKILARDGALSEFAKYVKYPRTFHLPWSEKVGRDDCVMKNCLALSSSNVVVTLKLDGENTTMYRDYIHARSIESGSHPSRNWVKGLWSRTCYNIPEGWRICGENMSTVHSIKYTDLASYFYVFSIWNEHNVCLSWKDTVEWAELLGLHVVPVLYEGAFNEDMIKKCLPEKYDGNDTEGYIVRSSEEIRYGEFRTKAGKFVRKSFVPGHAHWAKQKHEKNQLSSRP